MLPNKTGHWWHKRSQNDHPWPVYVVIEKGVPVIKHAHTKDIKQYGGIWVCRVITFDKAEEMKRLLSETLRYINISDDDTEIGEWVRTMKDEISEAIKD